MPPSEARDKARIAAVKALELDDTLAEAEVSLAFVTYSFDWDWAGGERHFRRAIELDPDYSTAHYWYSLYLGQLGRADEALAEAQRALDLEPVGLIGTYAVGLAHYYNRQFGVAAQFAHKALEIAPEFPPGRRLLGSTHLAQGRFQEAAVEFRRLYDAAPDNSLHAAWLAFAYGRAGERAKAREILNELVRESKVRFVPAAHIGIGYAGLDEVDTVMHWFEKAYVDRSQALTFLKAEPLFDPLRSDPRFDDLLRRVGLSRGP
jgi:tetratricopeptide (TPR) repeat protein